MNSDQIKVMCHVAGDNFSFLSILLSYYTRTETGTYGQVVSEGVSLV